MALSAFRLAIRNIIYFKRQYQGVFWGSVLAVSLISGSLSTGDSVRYSLLRQTENRLGKVTHVIQSQEFFFTDELADKIQPSDNGMVVPVLMLTGTVSSRSTGLSVTGVQIFGIPPEYENLFQHSADSATNPTQDLDTGDFAWARSNTRLARRLGVSNLKRDELLVRVEKTDSIPGDVPLVKTQMDSVPISVNLHGIMQDEEGGAFSLRPHQVMPMTLFVNKQLLEKSLQIGQRSNLILFCAGDKVVDTQALESIISRKLSLQDLRIRFLTTYSGIELSMDRIFIHPAIVEAVGKAGFSFKRRLSYFANSISFSEKQTPYSFVTGTEEIPVEPGKAIVNSWIAEDLGLSYGARINLTYYYPETDKSLLQKSAQFSVSDIYSINMYPFSLKLIPDFPGLTDAASCRDWNSGVPIALDKIRPKDEEYWDFFGATPKLIISYQDALDIFGNRFGQATALVFPLQTDTDLLETEFRAYLKAPVLGITVSPIKDLGMESASGSTDFGGLFTGMSIFIIAASLLLCSLLFSFLQDSRKTETALFFSTGFPKNTLAIIRFAECGIVSLAACFAGMVAGYPIAMLIIAGLSTIWQGAVGETVIFFHTTTFSLSTSFIAGFFATMTSLAIALIRDFRKNPALLFSQYGIYNTDLKRHNLFSRFIISSAFVLAGILSALLFSATGLQAGAFFVSGILLFTGMIMLCDSILLFLSRYKALIHRSIFGIAISNLLRSKKRSLAAVILLASGLFVVVSVGANKTEIPNSLKMDSGTGGYTLYTQLSMPIFGESSDQRFAELFGLQGTPMSDTSFAAIKVHEGDDGSCLNLNKPQEPAVLGIDPQLFATRGSFSFTDSITHDNTKNPWLLLDYAGPDDVIPAIADQTMITWSLGKSLGDRISVRSGDGTPIDIVFVASLSNSIFQGGILVSSRSFRKLFPSHSGITRLLIDTPDNTKDEDTTIFFQDRLSGFGAEVITTSQRLALFHEVENTYLLIFLALGGLGVILGSAGFGLIILKTMNERAAEIAMMQAMGFSKTTTRIILLLEHLLLLLAGILCGFVPAIVALIPSEITSFKDFPWIQAGLLVFLVGLLSFSFMAAVTFAVTRRDILPVLKSE